MLNALEELRKICRLAHTITPATAGAEYPSLPIAPTKPTKAPLLPGDLVPHGQEVKDDWNPAASAVLDIVVKADQPIPHPHIVKAMARREYPKKEAYAAIAYCQERGWIEHNLVSGYVLSGMAEIERAEREDLA